jgi:hypothetical protein
LQHTDRHAAIWHPNTGPTNKTQPDSAISPHAISPVIYARLDDSIFPGLLPIERSDQTEIRRRKIPSIRESSFEVFTKKEWES